MTLRLCFWRDPTIKRNVSALIKVDSYQHLISMKFMRLDELWKSKNVSQSRFLKVPPRKYAYCKWALISLTTSDQWNKVLITSSLYRAYDQHSDFYRISRKSVYTCMFKFKLTSLTDPIRWNQHAVQRRIRAMEVALRGEFRPQFPRHDVRCQRQTWKVLACQTRASTCQNRVFV